MRVSGRWLAGLAVCVLCAAGISYLAVAADTEEINLHGGAIWNGNKKRADVKAVLTPTGEREYSAVYTFTWEGNTHTWKGNIKGNLKSGNVAGTGATPDGRRTFVFQARAVKGVLTGKHYETTGGSTKLTGDIGLKQ
ncbi:MAG TPA: hypothetical protein VMZ92_08285 [Planctomycetota bacterium]|nr:hypothetical protein [Planctomycetota bacterium]